LVYTTPASRGGVRVESRVIIRSFEQLQGGLSKGDFGVRETGGCGDARMDLKDAN
jgi:hypothetical protein